MSRFEADRPSPQEETNEHRGHSRWMMIACCVPMLLIALLLVAGGAGVGFLIIAVACTAMMAAMMGGMSGGEGRGSGGAR
ncbi:MAG: hypothetical protein ABI726_06870 [bacterium]